MPSFDLPKPTKNDIPQPTGPLYVHGQPAGSSIEYNVAQGLDAIGLRYQYQYPVLGGRNRKGGSVIDFLVSTVPLLTPLYVQGDYWHGSVSKKVDDAWLLRRVRAALHYSSTDPVQIWENEALTIDQAISSLRRVLHI